MKKYLVIFLLFIACKNSMSVQEVNIEVPTYTIIETFIDSVTIGVKGRNKIEVNLFERQEANSVLLNFYSKKNNVWILKNTYSFEKTNQRGIDSKISDFNNDSFLDYHFNTKDAARGANNIRDLFIYSVAYDSLIYIKNSESYPNIWYNETLDCVNALLVSGSFYTAFLKLENDSLKEFASVDLADNIVVAEINKEGIRNIIMDTINTFGYFETFDNYKPLMIKKLNP